MQGDEYFINLKNELMNTAFKERTKLIERAALLLGVTKKNVYERLKKAGYDSGRKKRSDYGQTKMSDELALRLAGAVHLANRDNKKKIMPMKLAKEILEANGQGVVNEETGEVAMPSLTTCSRVMKAKGCHPSQLKEAKPAVGMRSLYPNHVWQIDASHCVLYYLPSGEVAAMEKDKFYDGKPHNLEKVKDVVIVRYIVIDHYSGAFYLHYSEGSERADEAVIALVKAMTDKGGNDVIRGIPKMLIMDKGSGNTGHVMTSFLENLGIQGITHEKGNPRAKGSVEQAQNLVETSFEGRLRNLEVKGREHLQALADKWRTWYCATKKHTRHGKTRFDMWNSINEEQLVMASSPQMLMEQAVMQRKKVKVNNKFMITLSSKAYGSYQYDVSIIPDIRIDEEVEVALSPFKLHHNAPIMFLTKTLSNGEKMKFEVLPQVKNDAGFNLNAPVFGEEFNSKPKSTAEKMEDKIFKMAYGTETLEEAKKMHKKKGKPFQDIDIMADIEDTNVYLSKQASDLKTKEEIARQELPPLSTFEIGMILRKKCPDWVKDPEKSMDWLKAQYPNGVAQDKVKEVIQAFNEKDMLIRQAQVIEEPKTMKIYAFDKEETWTA